MYACVLQECSTSCGQERISDHSGTGSHPNPNPNQDSEQLSHLSIPELFVVVVLFWGVCVPVCMCICVL